MTPEPKFLRRFEQIRTALRRHQARLGLAATVLAAATGLAVLAWSDYDHELSRPARAVGLAVATLATLGVMARWLVAPLRWWTRPRTASEIEARFPQLGQRIRTVVQYAGRPDGLVADEGVKPSLVRALEGETDERAGDLPLDRVVRRGRAFALASLAAVPVVWLALAATTSREWRTAIRRAVLIETPYTTVEVRPGDVLVDQGADVPLVVEVAGRPRKAVVLQTRVARQANAPWDSRTLDGPTPGAPGRREATIGKVKDSLEYRVVAGPAASQAHAIRVRYPLAIRSIEVRVTPPAYTGLDPRTTQGGDVQAVEGSTAAFRVAFDSEPAEAALELVDPSAKPAKPGDPAPAPTVVPLRRDGEAFVAGLDLAKDLDGRITARTADGRILPRTKFRIDVREDRAPRVSFNEPDEALEVHPIAEVRHRVRVDDDFGLARAGIVYRLNDGEEKTLIARDFPPAAPGRKPKTASTLEDVLLLEALAATPLDSVTYYAFAEDNHPGSPRRTETDLRYIDLRMFKREYKLAEPGSGDGDPMELVALDELIARQRVNLNRANRFARRRPGDRTPADDPLKIAGAEEALLNLTKDFTDGIERVADARVDALHKALDAMQASIDALDRSRNAEVPVAMAEALKNLVAARRELQTIIGANNPALAAAMRAFDRKQAQKIRKPKTKDEEAEEIADRLEELAKEEDFVYATIAAGDPGAGDAQAKGEPKADPAPPKDPAKDAEARAKAQAKEGTKAPDGPKGEGEQGPKPQAGKGQAQGQGNEGEGGQGDPKAPDRRAAVAEKQQEIADEARDLEEKLRRIEAVSDLAKARMALAAEKAEKASGALARGNAKEAADEAKKGAGMLHEVARQVKGEVAGEAADELAMARDLAGELARREAELAERAQKGPSPGDPAGGEGKAKGPKDGKGQGEGPDPRPGAGTEPGRGEGDKPGQGQGRGPGPGKGRTGGAGPGAGSWAGLTEEEQVDRMAEMARTLKAWLEQIDKRGEGKAAQSVRELLQEGEVAEVVERAARMGELRVGGKPAELSREAKELAARLEAIAQALEAIHRGIVAPELAALVEFDRRIAELTARMATLTTEAEAEAWRRDMAALARDLEKAGVDGAATLGDALRLAGGWHWDEGHHHLVVVGTVVESLRSVSFQVKDRVQDLILKDLASARDEATPPAFRELVERYYEVLSRGVRAR